jgi:hypothetical protein
MPKKPPKEPGHHHIDIAPKDGTSILDWVARRIARLLAPEAFRDADRYEHLRREIETAQQWLSHDFPEIGALTNYLLIGDHNHWRSLDELPVQSKWSPDIGRFREQLRHGEAS